MKRREAIEYLSILLGGTLSVPTLSMLQGCVPSNEKENIELSSPYVKQLLDEIVEGIIPTTDTPGAKQLGVAGFIIMMMQDCYDEKEQSLFLDGLKTIDKKSEKSYETSFSEATQEEREKLLLQIDQERVDYPEEEKKKKTHYFQLIKELTLLGYFTSKEGVETNLRYVAVPGRYDPCMPYKKGDKAWAI